MAHNTLFAKATTHELVFDNDELSAAGHESYKLSYIQVLKDAG